jgi:hypothetical protein
MDAIAILQPVIVMGLLTVAMTVWMYATRIPAMSRAGIDPQATARQGKRALDALPPEVTRVADNYNHLFEQPTLFYAMALLIAVLGHVDPIHVACAWVFAGVRIAHSLVQATVNIILIRFALFCVCWIALAIMIFREALAVF